LSDRNRIFHEVAAMRVLAPHLPAGSVPEILFEDRDHCCFAMSAAPAGAPTWKDQLMAGEICIETAARIGAIQAAIMRATRPEFADQFGDQTVFDQLRLDPYYREIARRHPDLAEHIDRMMRESSARRTSLVHGDWSPKNFLVSGEQVMAIDFEVI